jgi:hypothetical protein
MFEMVSGRAELFPLVKTNETLTVGRLKVSFFWGTAIPSSWLPHQPPCSNYSFLVRHQGDQMGL